MRGRLFWSALVAIAFCGKAIAAADELVEDTVVASSSEIDGSSVESTSDDADEAATSAATRTKSNEKRVNGNGRYSVPDPALELVDPRTYRLRVIIRIEATDSPVKNVVATGPIPMDWPEQRVRLI